MHETNQQDLHAPIYRTPAVYDTGNTDRFEAAPSPAFGYGIIEKCLGNLCLGGVDQDLNHMH